MECYVDSIKEVGSQVAHQEDAVKGSIILIVLAAAAKELTSSDVEYHMMPCIVAGATRPSACWHNIATYSGLSCRFITVRHTDTQLVGLQIYKVKQCQFPPSRVIVSSQLDCTAFISYLQSPVVHAHSGVLAYSGTLSHNPSIPTDERKQAALLCFPADMSQAATVSSGCNPSSSLRGPDLGGPYCIAAALLLIQTGLQRLEGACFAFLPCFPSLQVFTAAVLSLVRHDTSDHCLQRAFLEPTSHTSKFISDDSFACVEILKSCDRSRSFLSPSKCPSYRLLPGHRLKMRSCFMQRNHYTLSDTKSCAAS